MPPKFRPKKPTEVTILSQGSAVSSHSIYGDDRATTEDAMMLAHAQRLRANSIIDDNMATQLSRPWHKGGELKTKYTKEYLELHPNYTGKDAHEMPGLDWAKRKRKEKDREMEQWLEDYRLGRIDENGDPIGDYSESLTSSSSCSEDEDEDAERDLHEGHTGDTRLSVEEDDELWLGQPPTVEATKRSRIDRGEKDNASKHAATTQTNSSELTKHTNNDRATSIPRSSNSSDWSDFSSPPLTTAPVRSPARPILKSKTISKTSASISSPLSALSSLPSSSSSSPLSTPKPKLVRKRHHSIPSPPPLPPHPGNQTYESLDYFALIGICRTRGLPGSGRAPFIRNRIIQDDINLALGKTREIKKNKFARRKIYKHAVPGDQANGSSNGTSNEGSKRNHDRNSSGLSRADESESGEENVDMRNVVGRRSEKRKRVEALESKEESADESENAFEVLTGPRVIKRKRREVGKEGEQRRRRLSL